MTSTPWMTVRAAVAINAPDAKSVYAVVITTEQRCSIDTKPIAKLFKSGRLEDDLMFPFVLDRLAALKAANPGREVVRSKLGVLVWPTVPCFQPAS